MRDGQVLVTGSSGRVGRVLFGGLGARAVAFDLPDGDVLDVSVLAHGLAACDQVVHLAWNSATESYDNGGQDPANRRMVASVLEGAHRLGVGRVVLASSVHAGSLSSSSDRMIHPDDEPTPATPYGESKVEIERMGRDAAGWGLDVVAIRFGGVQDRRHVPADERGLWLRPDDCVGAVSAVLHAPVRPGRFAIFYAISRSRWQRHSTVNDFGWRPRRPPVFQR